MQPRSSSGPRRRRVEARRVRAALWAVAFALSAPSEASSWKYYSAPPAEQPYSVVTDDGVTLHGRLYSHPMSSRNAPAVIVLHGYNGSAELTAPSARLLQEAGYSALALSMRGWGRSGGQDDCGLRQAVDVSTVMNDLSKSGPGASKEFGVLGFSQGGQVGLLAAQRDERISAVVAFFPVTDVQRWARTTNNERIPGYVRTVCSPRSADRSPIASPQSLHAPTLLVHGGRDGRVPTEQSILFAQAVRSAGGDIRLSLVPGAGHAFTQKNWQHTWPKSVSHLSQHLRRDPPSRGKIALDAIKAGLDDLKTALSGSRVIGIQGLPLLVVKWPESDHSDSFYLDPGCPTCNERALLSIKDNAQSKRSFSIVLGAQLDYQLDLLGTLFCAPPARALAAVLENATWLSSTTAKNNTQSVSDMAAEQLRFARTSVGTPRQDIAACIANHSFRRAAIAAGHIATEPSQADALAHSGRLGLARYGGRHLGGTGNGPTATDIASDRRAFWEAEVARGRRELLEIEKQNLKLDVLILAANTTDALIGAIVSSVPGGSAAYSTGKTTGYLAMGEAKEAATTAAVAVMSSIDPFKALDEVWDAATAIIDVKNILDTVERIDLNW